MDPARNPIALSTLIAEATWVRALAERLVRDRAEAEDVVQDTWLAALRAPPPEDGRLRPWLARVVLNFARRARRGEAHRSAREARAARSERLPAASEALERLELQRLLVDAIESLDEPYRMTVILRHLDGVTAEEIAKRHGVPASTVRWRLKKGIDELRARLDRRFGGDRGAWALALVPLVPRPSLGEIATGSAATTAQAVLQGGLAMNTATKAGIAAALVLTASVGVWMAVEERAPSAPASRVAAETEFAPALDTSESSTSASLELAAAQEAEAPARAAVSEPRDLVAAHAPSPTRIEARFVDRFDRPVPRVELTLEQFPDLAPRSSADDGRLSLELDPPRDSMTTDFTAARMGFATHFGNVSLKRGEVVYLGDIRLSPGGSIAGRVLGPDGRPAEGAEVRVTPPELETDSDEARVRGPSHAADRPETRTGADGRFRIDGVRAGFVRVWAAADDTRWSATLPLEVPEASVLGDVEIHLVALETDDTIEGIVLSPAGEPVPNADVRYDGRAAGGRWSGNFSARADGRFKHRVPVRGPHDLVARDRAGRWPDAIVPGVLPGTHDVVLQFPPERWLELTVRASHTGPTIEEFATTVMSADGTRTLNSGKLELHEDGRARLLVPGEPFKIEVRARGRGGAELGPWSPSDAPAAATCTLERRIGVRGRVTHAGEPVAGARVALYEMSDPLTRIESNGYPTRLHPKPEDESTSDADGWFELDPSRPDDGEGRRFFQRERASRGEFAILCEASGFARAEVSPLDIDPEIGVDGVDIALSVGGTIEGRVLTAPGRDPAGVVVAIDRTDGHPASQRVGPDGRFRFDRLTPGAWNVTRAEKDVSSSSWSTSWTRGDKPRASFPTNCKVYDGESTRHDLDLTDDRPCVLRAHVSANGLPAAGWTARLHPSEGATGRESSGGAVDSAGVLVVEVKEPGAYELELAPPGDDDVSFALDTSLQRGDNALPVELRTASLRGKVAQAADDISVMFESSDGRADGVRCRASVRPADDGSFELPTVSAGPARVCRMQVTPEGGTRGPLAELRLEIAANATLDIVVP